MRSGAAEALRDPATLRWQGFCVDGSFLVASSLPCSHLSSDLLSSGWNKREPNNASKVGETMNKPLRDPFTDPNISIRDSHDDIEIQHLGVLDYQEAWDLQAKLAAQRYRGEIPDQILVVEHPSLYTAGKRTQDSDRPTNGLPVIDVDRGGRITWHGPGQLVCYPIIKLRTPVDVVDYVRRLEEAIIHCLRGIGLAKAGRIDGRSGVWIPADHAQLLPDRKIAALGIRVTHGVTMHGLSINCNNSMDAYLHIIPCGISDAGVTSVSQELGVEKTPQDLVESLLPDLLNALDGSLAVANHSFGSAPNPSGPSR